MKEFLFAIIVILLTPVYIVIQLHKKTIEFVIEIFGPLVDAINLLTQNMIEFWEKIFKGEK